MGRKVGFSYGTIKFDNAHGVYQPGQMVYGKLEFDLSSILNFRGIYAVIRGYCEVYYTENKKESGKSENVRTEHRSEEDYLNKTVYLAGSIGGSAQLNQGHHTFPFECLLPNNCPSSFEGPHGHIRYQVRVILDKAFNTNEEKLAAIKVVAPLDLNSNPYCREPVDFEMINSYCCWCISSGASETIVHIPRSGFCCGEVVPVDVACTNRSSVKIKSIKLNIQKKITYHAECEPGTKDEAVKIMELSTGPVEPNTTKNFTVELKIPTVDVYNLYGSRFIDLQYYFYVRLEVKGCHSDVEDSRRIIIGNLPLIGPGQAMNQMQQGMPYVQPYPTSPMAYSAQPPYNPQVTQNLLPQVTAMHPPFNYN
ncbi:hypothetical protein K1T71_009093 [Dendrolimus kikuchii]|uniref:Uncharacterized protein n=1 Tax=Dendrolimus kikuchii TaxID=765133 RepID=A0ACC1CUI3_9NEOP|nr:hypothetical protein K1T71_009093 [Dendrolimus kikuchii]